MSGERSGMGECIRGDGDVEWIEGRVGVRGVFFFTGITACVECQVWGFFLSLRVGRDGTVGELTTSISFFAFFAISFLVA